MKVEIAIRPIKDLIQELGNNPISRKFLLFAIEDGGNTSGHSIVTQTGTTIVIGGQFVFDDISATYSHFADFPDISQKKVGVV